MTDLIKPTETTDRITSLDFMRGVAVLGILFINIENFAYPDSWSPWKFGFHDATDHLTRFWVYFLTQGKFYTMFALLFGVGFYMFLERFEKRQAGLKAMDIYARRLLWLFVIGVLHAYLIWDGDVLYHYAICGLLLIPFRSVNSRGLLFVILLLSVSLLVKSYDQTGRRKVRLTDYSKAIKIPEEQRSEEHIKAISLWEKQTRKRTPDSSVVKPRKETYLTGLKETFKGAKVHKGLLYYQSLLFPSLIVMIIGIIFYRAGIFTDYRAWKYYWLITLTVLLIGFVVNYLRYYHWTFQYDKPVTDVLKGWLFTFPKELLGVGYVLLINGLYQKFLRSGQLKVISNIGRAALSNYIFQNILLGVLFYGYGFGFFNQFSRTELLLIVVLIWGVQIFLSWIWFKRFSRGPLEWVWRKLTYNSFRTKDDRE